ncbi:hypothetical protein Brsp06_04956 [Brucella sp. NBRC 13694]|uniref:hypothetical protein n=1 Tax=Brucella/Ochrobactrum group TaxID=2826938 RepID=UPI000F66DFC1|nr:MULTISPECIES: hypothetical protein [Brucella/Ochrobactrum group]MCQ9148381.1 hypothetical protein [Ochrobactrum sp. BTU2]MCR5943625.1 hypothetical protein [Ochrobactrum sp. XJ1]RRY15707.1 hypothetical protein EGJ57_24170 [Brucella anthropi]
MTSDEPDIKQINTLIARILIGKPELTPLMLRRIIPKLDHYDDQALAQKIEHLRCQNAKRRPLRY